MFGRRNNHKRRSNPIFVAFRLFLSLAIFAILFTGVYSAYKQFSGADLLELSPKALMSNFSSPEKISGFISSFLKINLKQKAKEITGQINGKQSYNQKPQSSNNLQAEKPQQKAKSVVSFKFALVADSHNENANLAKALNQAKKSGVQFVIGLGDYTEIGTTQELENAKSEFDKAGIRYFLTAGDHDLWDSRDKGLSPSANFNKIFGLTYQSFSFGNAKILILDNSDNYLGLGEPQLKWLGEQMYLVKNQNEINVIFTFLHEPLYHPSSTRFMGKVNSALKDEGKKIIHVLKDGGVKEVFSGDIHFFTRYTESETGLSMTTIGALTSQRNTQEPRFGLVTVYEDGSYEVEDVEIK